MAADDLADAVVEEGTREGGRIAKGVSVGEIRG